MIENLKLIANRARQVPKRWLVTGAAGFIGSHLVETLLQMDQEVIGLDNLSTGNRGNLSDVEKSLEPHQLEKFKFIEGDITSLTACREACAGVSIVLHQAALGSVPRSLSEPLRSHLNNVDGFINILEASRAERVHRFVYASSSSVYGDHPILPKEESNIGRPLSPYAATKLVNEIYASVYSRNYSLPTIGLRYFNVFGPRQNPYGEYAAVIPRWLEAMTSGSRVAINGDGATSRDFCYVKNVVQANILAALTPSEEAVNRIYNIAAGQRTTLVELFEKIKARVAKNSPRANDIKPDRAIERPGDVKHSFADISLAQKLLGYCPSHDLDAGLDELMAWENGRRGAKTT